MDAGQIIYSAVMTIVVYGIIAFAVYKILTLSRDMSEVKELLKEIQRNTQDHSVDGIGAGMPGSQAQTAANLARAVNDAFHSEYESENADIAK